MQESTSPRYIIATCNDIGDLLAISQGALLRRFDDVFFVDMPSEKERAEILAIMNARYRIGICCLGFPYGELDRSGDREVCGCLRL